jgi:regulatory protein
VVADAAPAEALQRPRKEKTLLARALGHLARREHSRAELGRKLAPHAASDAELRDVLDELESRRLLSDARFADMLARSRGGRFGAARVQQELKAHRLDDALVRSAVADLKTSELARARALWQRRFGERAVDRAERLRQMRFLAGRGFAPEVIRKVVSGSDDD